MYRSSSKRRLIPLISKHLCVLVCVYVVCTLLLMPSQGVQSCNLQVPPPCCCWAVSESSNKLVSSKYARRGILLWFVGEIGARGSEDAVDERGEWKDRIKKTVRRVIAWKVSFIWFPLKAESGNQLQTPHPTHTHTLSQPTIFPECAAYFPCQGGVLDSKFHLMSKTVRHSDYIKKDVEDGGVSWI